MSKKIRLAGLVFVLGLLLSLGNWQRQGKAAGQQAEAAEPPSSTASPFVQETGQAPAAVASTITVTSDQDGAANAANCPGPNCRLRDAIAAAVAGDTINFSVSGTITLNSGELLIGKNLTVNGPGLTQLTISGNNASRVIRIGLGRTVALSGLTIANGNGSQGGGIWNPGGNLTLTNSKVTGNQGSGIRNQRDATLTITNSTVSDNIEPGSGGGIVNFGTLILTNSTVYGNSLTLAAGVGGGIYNFGTAVLTNSTISGNLSGGSGFNRRSGGAPDIGAFELQSGGIPPPVVVTNSSDSGPGSLREALATVTPCGTITFASGISRITLTSAELVINKNLTINGPGANLLTISGNGARRIFTISSGTFAAINGLTIANGVAGGVDGGGINNFGLLTLSNCTLSGNSAERGGGICNNGEGSLALATARSPATWQWQMAAAFSKIMPTTP